MQTLTVNEQVISVLSNAGIKFNIIPAGSGLKRDNWECDGWMLQLHKNNNTQMFEYYTGIGHREVSKVDAQWITREFNSGKFPRGNFKHKMEQYTKPVAPEVCGIIHTLNLDSQALDESFPSWCDNFGYDSDSLKALNVYNQCCDTAKKYYSIVDRATREALEVILSDY
jgi:hypothetical protein